ncbi:proline hydroxylase [Saccharospirillum sp. MSK14-1]|uniref:2OG-Fe(II) oxygenase n=1 Tax=Saccharospirillum sp. MSK14-1 TaxID=1897632 RepID=UPI000D3A2984|nr:2OG-Fe(II) oxygenase [Saccharospirillum sp. MSK14-1]PTY37710.1 proline hydroxylase [Saccharospirillum sp. MSK14-1]
MIQRLNHCNWPALESELDHFGNAPMPALLQPEQCQALIDSYADRTRFRSRVIMQRHGFGQGEYQYFDDPLPELIAELRAQLYERLVPLANRWSQRLGFEHRYPATHAEFIRHCHAAGQTQPTPLLLRYGAGDYNCLHQDLYGPLAFPLQLTVMLSQLGEDFRGGEFTLVEQRPRRQSRPDVVSLQRGDAVVFAGQYRPVTGARGDYRVTLRHGVSRVRSGERFTLGLIFHDAQ